MIMRNKAQNGRFLTNGTRTGWILTTALLLVACREDVAAQTAGPNASAVSEQKIKGADHPELFSRRIAFEMFLNLLAVDAADAPHLQRRARFLQEKQIGLGTDDASALDQIVERYRVQRDAITGDAASLRAEGVILSSFAPTLGARRNALLKDTLNRLNQSLSKAGKQQVNLYLDHIIQKSERGAVPQGVQK